MICPNCSKEISDTSKFCRFCGKRVENGIYCEKCGASLETDSLFCSKCGTPVSSTGASGAQTGASGLRWEEDSNGDIFITGQLGNREKIVIPPTINDKRVTEIGAGAFFEDPVIKEVTISNSVSRIGYRAFRKCRSLQSIVLPHGITEIGKEMFFGCVSLTSVTIPLTVRSIETAAFFDCSSLTELTLPDSVEQLGSKAFEHCKKLKITYKGKTYSAIDPSYDPTKLYKPDYFKLLYADINRS